MTPELACLANADRKLYHPLEHPDFPGWDVAQPCVERWAMIRAALHGVTRGTALDLGCHTGWFSRRLAAEGWAVTGIDRSQEWLGVARAMGGPEWAKAPEYRWANIGTCELPQSDVALALSLLMYLFQREDDELGWEFLDRLALAAPIAFIDSGGMYAEHVPPPAELAGQIVKRTAYRHAKLLGRSLLEGREMWMLEREHTQLRAWWVMGATGVGKRHFMRLCEESETGRGFIPASPRLAWQKDGDERNVDTLAAECGTGSALIRWQWGREAVLSEWVRRPRLVEHRIALLSADPYIHAARIRRRDGRRMSPMQCAFEAGAVNALAERLSAEHGVPIDRIDVTEDA